MQFVANLKTGQKLAILILIPLLGFLFLTLMVFREKGEQARHVATMAELMQLVDEAGALVHQVQVERGASSLYLARRDADDRTRLQQRWAETDAAVERLAASLKSHPADDPVVEALARPLATLATREAFRRQVAARAVDPDAMLAWYSDVNRGLLGAGEELVRAAREAALGRDLMALNELMWAREHLGLERSLLGRVFSSGRITAKEREALAVLKARIATHREAFLTYASEAQRAVFKERVDGLYGDEAARMEAAAVSAPAGIDPEAWFRVQTGLIDQYYEVEHTLLSALGAQQRERADAVAGERNLFLIEVLAVLVLSLLGAWVIYGTIRRPLLRARDLAERLAEGDLRVEVPDDGRRDEVGELMRSLGRMVAQWRTQMSSLLEGVNVLAAASTEISASISQVTSSVAQTATSVQETSATVEEVKKTAEVSSEQAHAVVENVQQVESVTHQGRQAVNHVVDSMDRIKRQMERMAEHIVYLSEQGQTIGEIITTVKDLAEQSNLLAVNASIEAAKAGEQGKGFAVLAQEIRSLAEQSREATLHIREALTRIQKATGDAVMATEQGVRPSTKASGSPSRPGRPSRNWPSRSSPRPAPSPASNPPAGSSSWASTRLPSPWNRSATPATSTSRACASLKLPAGTSTRWVPASRN